MYMRIYMYTMCIYIYIYIYIYSQGEVEGGALRRAVREEEAGQRATRRAAGGGGPWGSTNRVVSNRVVSKGPLYPSKTNIIIYFVF